MIVSPFWIPLSLKNFERLLPLYLLAIGIKVSTRFYPRTHSSFCVYISPTRDKNPLSRQEFKTRERGLLLYARN